MRNPNEVTKKDVLDFLRSATHLKLLKFRSGSGGSTFKCVNHGTEFRLANYKFLRHRYHGCLGCQVEGRNAAKLVTLIDRHEAHIKAFNGRIVCLDKVQDAQAKIRYRCTLHPDRVIEKSPAAMLRSPQPCSKCKSANASARNRTTQEGYETKLAHVWGDKQVCLGEYKGADVDILHRCNIHGVEWMKNPRSLKYGCPQCSSDNAGRGILSREGIEKRLVRNHGQSVRLLSKSWSGVHSVVQWQHICGKSWSASIDSVTRPKNFSGCPHCALNKRTSKAEDTLFRWVKKRVPDAEQSYLLQDEAGNFEVDVYVPSKRIALEYNGLYWHSYPKRPKSYHADKTRRCANVGVRLVHVYEDDFHLKAGVLKKTLRHILGLTTEIVYARKTEVKVARTLHAVRHFYETNHMQGCPKSGTTVGLFSERELVAAMTFSNPYSNRGSTKDAETVELVRFATVGSVVGGASKLFKAFLERNPAVKTVVSYSDSDMFDGSIYEKLGFTKVKDVPPDYKTVWGNVRKPKAYTKKSRLPKLLPEYDPKATEEKNLLDHGIPMIFDSGKKKWEYTRKGIND